MEQNNGTCHSLPRAKAWMGPRGFSYYIVKLIVIEISLVLNVIMFLTITCSKQLRTTPNIFIASLALSDFIYAIVNSVHSFIIVNGIHTGYWPDFCQNVGSILEFFYLFSLVSTYCNLFLIALERWIFITRPFLHQRIESPKLTAGGIILVWLIAIFANIDKPIMDRVEEKESKTLRYDAVMPPFHFLWSFILFGIYAHIAVITRRHIRVIHKSKPVPVAWGASESTKQPVEKNAKQRWKSTKMLVASFGTFFVLLSPLMILTFCKAIELPGAFSEAVDFPIKTIANIHYSSNFVVYGLQNRAFRTVLLNFSRRILCRPTSPKPENFVSEIG